MKDGKNILLTVLKGAAISIAILLALVLVFALLVDIFAISEGVIKPINYLIKTIAVVVGCFLSIKGDGGFLKGMVTGGLSLILAFFILGIIGGNIEVNLSFLWEVLFGIAIGGVAGALSVNLRK